MKWKNKKGKRRAIGVSGCCFTIKKIDGIHFLKMEENPGNWKTVGKYVAIERAIDAAQKADDVKIHEVLEYVEHRRQMLTNIARSVRMRTSLKREFPPSFVTLFKEYVKMSYADRLHTDRGLDQKNLGSLIPLLHLVKRHNIYI